MPEIAVRCQNLVKRYEKVTAVDHLDLEVQAGECFGLLGPNGAGKTTLLKILATLILPDDGAATISGHDIVREPMIVKRLVTPVIASERSLYWRLSARENLMLFAALYDVPRSETPDRIEHVLDVVGLRDTGSKLVGQFSSGMMQRLLIARALLASPRVLLLDEPTRSLDPLSARDFRRFLREELADRRGCAVLLATHSADEAFELCDRVAVLDRGVLLATGSTPELSTEFIGTRYQLWTTAPEHAALAKLGARGGARVVGEPSISTEGWSTLTLEIDGRLDGASRALQQLVAAGMPIARFESASFSLAELIERVVQHRGGR